VFARHETFEPRYGWLKKAADATAADWEVFTRQDATVTLGVGKNMVRAIRFWGLAAKVLAEKRNPERPRQPFVVPSVLGEALLGTDGLDPYTEDPGTLWLLHWLLLAPPSWAPVWWLAFHEFGAAEFTDDDLWSFVANRTAAVPGWKQPNAKSLKRDADLLLRMYAPRPLKRRQPVDDALNSPFRGLGLIGSGGDQGAYRFLIGRKPTLPSAVAAFASLDFLARTDAQANTVSVSRLASEPGGPGRAFQLTESNLAELLRQAAATYEGVTVASPAGAAQLSVDGNPATVATQLLASYYAAELGSPRLLAGDAADQPADEPIQSELDTITDPIQRLVAREAGRQVAAT
jgi:hypothetical protein